MAMVPPGARESKILARSLRLRASPSLWRMWPRVATLWPVPKSASTAGRRRDEGEAVGEAEAGYGFLGDGDDLGPVDCGDADARRGLREGDAPDAGAGGEIEYAGGLAVEVEGLCEGLSGGVAHGEDVDDEFFEELGACLPAD